MTFSKEYNKSMNEYNVKLEDDYIWDGEKYVPIIQPSKIVKPSFPEILTKTEEELQHDLYKAQFKIYEIEKKYGIYTSMMDEIRKSESQISILEIIWKLIKLTPKIIKVILAIITILSYIQRKK